MLRLHLVDFIEEHLVKDFSHDLDGTRQHVEQLVGQMITTLANIRLARSVVDKVAHIFFAETKFYIMCQFSESGYQCVSEMGSCLTEVSIMFIV